MVRVRGLEPPRLATMAPKAIVSTNSTTLALFVSTTPSIRLTMTVRTQQSQVI
jgi:hypothetical protein